MNSLSMISFSIIPSIWVWPVLGWLVGPGFSSSWVTLTNLAVMRFVRYVKLFFFSSDRLSLFEICWFWKSRQVAPTKKRVGRTRRSLLYSSYVTGGYGFVHIPCAPGQHELPIVVSRPQGSFMDSVSSTFSARLWCLSIVWCQFCCFFFLFFFSLFFFLLWNIPWIVYGYSTCGAGIFVFR